METGTTFWRFLEIGADVPTALSGQYNYSLVLLSYAVMSVAAFTALEVVRRISAAATTQARFLWTLQGAVTMGCGVWAMHFIGMLAFSVEGPMGFNIPLTALSALPAVIASFFALRLLSNKTVRFAQLQLGALQLAVGIGTMHYLGMEAMYMNAELVYHLELFVLSIVAAHVLATAALHVKFYSPKWRAKPDIATRIGSALIMGAAVSGMHYIAMEAAEFLPSSTSPSSHAVMNMQHGLIGMSVALISLIIAGLGMISVMVDRRFATMFDMLRKSQHQAQSVLNSAGEGILGIDLNTNLTFINPAALALLGYEEEELINRDIHSLLHPPGPEGQTQCDGACVLSVSHALTRGGNVQEDAFTCKSGLRIPIEGKATRLIEQGRVVGAVVTFSDVSARKQLETQLVQAQKLESIGQLAAGIAHEINTPAQFASHNAHFLNTAFKKILPVFPEFEQLLASAATGTISDDSIERATEMMKRAKIDYLSREIPNALSQTQEGLERIAGIVSAMKEFSHPGSECKSLLDLNHALANTIIVSSHEWKYVAQMEQEYDPELPAVSCFPGELSQVFLNIIVNAAQAIAELPSGANDICHTITVQTRRDDGFARVIISDTGPGMTPEVRARIFDPFFTTKEVGRGTGQGLSISYNAVVEKHGGTIECLSEPGKGTTFIIGLPLPINSSTQTDEVLQ